MAFALAQPVVGAESSGSASVSLAYGSNNTAGNLLIAVGRYTTSGAVPTISDTQGNTWVPVGIIADNGLGQSIKVWYVSSCKGGPNTVTFSSGTIFFVDTFISEYSGQLASGPLDTFATAQGTGTALSVGPLTTAVNGELLVVVALENTGTKIITAGAGFTVRISNGANPAAHQEDTLSAGVAGSYTGTATWSASTSWGAMMLAFKPASATTGYSVPDSRVVTSTTPNSSRVVNGTAIYDVPKIDSRAAGAPVDCRIAPNIPVDSRVAPNIPQNSRQPGTFGPGE